MRYMEACSSVQIAASFPSVYHDEVAVNVSKVAVLRDILCQHYNIPKEGFFSRDIHNIVNQRVEKESIERCIGGTDVIKDIVWRHYGLSCPTLSNHKYSKREKLRDPVYRQKRVNEYKAQQKVQQKPIKIPKVQQKPIKIPKIKLKKESLKPFAELKLKEIEQGKLEREELYQKFKEKSKLKKQPKIQFKQTQNKPNQTQLKKMKEEINEAKRIEKEKVREEKKQQKRIEKEKVREQVAREREKAKREREYQNEANRGRLNRQLNNEWRNWGKQLTKVQKEKKTQEYKPSQSVVEKRNIWIEKDKKREIKEKRESELNEMIKQERLSIQDKQGIEKFYTPDPNNVIDQEILHNIRGDDFSYSRIVSEESKCRNIIARRVNLGVRSNKKERMDADIMIAVERRCKRLDNGWNETVRELFCIEFNIKQQCTNTDIRKAPEIII